MTDRRPYVLAALLAAFSVVAGFILVDVLGTVFFAVTVAYLLFPLRERLVDRGLSAWWASAASTLAALGAGVLVTAPLGVVLFVRFQSIVELLALVPEQFAVELFGLRYVVTLEQVVALLTNLARSVVRTVAVAGPVLLVKLGLFVLLVFALVYHRHRTRRAILAVVPPDYRDVAAALNRRARETLFAIYVLQAATAVGTFLLALPFFTLLGYSFPVTLAVVAALLQFLPIVGPSLLLVGLAAYHVTTGDVASALVVLVGGGVLVAALPDLLVRPRLARETADLPGSLYFVGFTGGLLSLGAVGVIAGPLVVALVVELTALLSAELDPAAGGEQ
ncbi:MAG: AI-2E family transporter [Haloferacaceae archaeon]